MSTAASLLGLPPQARIVILHVDDVGMCHGANAAFLELFRTGAVDSGSIMVPCPWFAEIAAAARNDAALDLGVHLTLTSEWEGYRWRAISTTSQSSGLLDDDGYLPRRCHMLRRRSCQAAKIEVRAQIDRARESGIDTHLDTHGCRPGTGASRGHASSRPGIQVAVLHAIWELSRPARPRPR
jgi:predicted glycoside hydrolase/deacetylase ChbG (UPF0249 family)